MLSMLLPPGDEGDDKEIASPLAGQQTCRIVLISGFESFNTGLYRQARSLTSQGDTLTSSSAADSSIQPVRHCISAVWSSAAGTHCRCYQGGSATQARLLKLSCAQQAAREVGRRCPGVMVTVVSDRDLEPQRERVEQELARSEKIKSLTQLSFAGCA